MVIRSLNDFFSTSELSLETSILPIVVNGRTSLHTLTQSFYITKLVEAVKTLPPGKFLPLDSNSNSRWDNWFLLQKGENYEFVATKAFKDFNNILEEAGSEKREHLLPGIFLTII